MAEIGEPVASGPGSATAFVRRWAGRVVYTGLRRSGATSLAARSSWRRQRLVVLCYHGVSLRDEHEWCPGLYLPPQEFARQLEIIDELGYQVVPLESGLQRMAAGELDKPSVVITFDDGFADFVLLAAPLLQKHSMAATVYLTTYYAEKQLPLFNLMCPYLLWMGRSNLSRLHGEFGITDRLVSNGPGGAALAAAEAAVFEWRKTRPPGVEEDTRITAEVAGRLGIDWEELLRQRVLQLMSQPEVQSLAAEGIDFQLHTHRHRTPDDQAAYRREIDDNRRVIEAWTGKVANHYCYPSGVWTPKVHPWLSEAGVETATTCVAGIASRESAQLALPRYLISAGLRENHFAALLSGVSGMLQSSS